MEPPLGYKLDSRLLIANICEAQKALHVDGRLAYESLRCGAHYYVISERGLELIRRDLEE